MYGSPASVGVDTAAPAVTSFTATSPSTSLGYPDHSLHRLGRQRRSPSYPITASATPPSAGAAGWTASAPTIYTVASDGSCTLYPWAKDAAGNVSATYGSPASVSVDTSAPTVDTFTATSPSTSLDIPITAFTASTPAASPSYLITASATPPSVRRGRLDGLGADHLHRCGRRLLHSSIPGPKDAAGNVSAAYGSPASVSVDTSAPTVDTFTATSPSASLNIPITAFTASDASGVTGYLITESATPPSAGARRLDGLGPHHLHCCEATAPTRSTPGPKTRPAMSRRSTAHPPA